MYILIKLTKKLVFLLSLEQQVIMWNIRKYRNAAWETQVGVRWNLRQVCQVRWAYQIIPSNRFWITRCDWVTTINKVTWVQANWKHKHTHTHTHKNTQSEWLKCYLLTQTMIMQSELWHISKQTKITWFIFIEIIVLVFFPQMLIQKSVPRL